MTTETLEALKKEIDGPGSWLSEYRKQKRAQTRKGNIPLPFAKRFTVALFEFNPSFRPLTPKWKPAHALSVPSLRLLQESSYSDEISFEGEESPFWSRGAILMILAEQNQHTLDKIAAGSSDREFCWLLAVELGIPKVRMTFADVDWHSGLWGLNHLTATIVHPTAEEIAKYAGKVGAA